MRGNEEVWGLILRTVNSHSFYLGNKAENVEINRAVGDGGPKTILGNSDSWTWTVRTGGGFEEKEPQISQLRPGLVPPLGVLSGLGLLP